jgi:hypothetical protein
MPKLVTADEVPNLLRYKAKHAGPVVTGRLLRVRLVVERIGQRLVLVLILEAFIALPHLVVGDQRRAILLGQRLEVGVGVVAGVRRDQGVVT